MTKLAVENVLDLDRTSVLLLDRLIEKYLFICNEGRTIGRSIGVYTAIREELEKVARISQEEAVKSNNR